MKCSCSAMQRHVLQNCHSEFEFENEILKTCSLKMSLSLNREVLRLENEI
jgi:hypothetical protein